MRFEAKVKEVVTETPKVGLVRLAWPGVEKFSFRPGQWVGVYCDDFRDENNRPVRRAFSIASVPGEPFLELCVARGPALSAHLQDLEPGATVHVDGPYGLFWLRPAQKYVFVAGGTGIAPFRPMLHEALKAGAEVLLVYSIKTPSDFIYRDELEGLAQNHKKFKLVVTLTVDEFPNWKGERGRVQTFLDKYFTKGCLAYVCGPPGMVEGVENKLVELGQPKEEIYVDKWEA